MAGLCAVAALAACGGGDDDATPAGANSPTEECVERWNSPDNAEGHLGIVIPPVTRAFVGVYEGPTADAAVLAGSLSRLRLEAGDCVVVPSNDIPGDLLVCQPGGWVRAGGGTTRNETDSYLADAKKRPNADVVPADPDSSVSENPEVGKLILGKQSSSLSGAQPNACGGEPASAPPTESAPTRAETATTQPEPTATQPAPPPPKPEPTLIGEWVGQGALRGPSGNSVDTYTQRLTIDSLEPGEVAGRTVADYEFGGHCGGELTTVDGEGGSYVFEYREADNPEGCVPMTEVFLSLTEAGTLRYRERDPSGAVTVRGTMHRVG